MLPVRKSRVPLTLMILIFLGLYPIQLQSQDACTADLCVNVAVEQTSGDIIRGPATIELKNLNGLRYDIRVGQTSSFTAGPDLAFPLIPAISSPMAAPSEGASIENVVAGKFPGIMSAYGTVRDRWTNGQGIAISNAIQKVNDASDSLTGLILASDSILQQSGGLGLIAQINPVETAVTEALMVAWPVNQIEVEAVASSLDQIELQLLALRAEADWESWYMDAENKLSYDSWFASIREFQTSVRSFGQGSERETNFRTAQAKLRPWNPILQNLSTGEGAFTHSVRVGCGFAFAQTKSTKVEIIKRDRSMEDASESREEIVTVECTTPLSISGGIGFSSINEKDIAFVQSKKETTDADGQTTTTAVNQFGVENQSDVRTVPLLLLNTRIIEKGGFGLHASAGTAVDIKTGEAGTDIEFVFGPSVSLWRSLFLTLGWHRGRAAELAGGFEIGQEVPSSVSAPPLQKSWQDGFVFAFTYKIR